VSTTLPVESVAWFAVSVVAEHTLAFLEDMERERRAGKRHTAFLVLVWTPPADVAAQMIHDAERIEQTTSSSNEARRLTASGVVQDRVRSFARPTLTRRLC